jgi:hypothetical protein
MRYFSAFLFYACTIGLAAQIAPRPRTPEAQIAAAEAAGASFPRASGTADAPARKCTLVRPDQIVFPSTHGEPGAFSLVSGDFSAFSISFGWDRTYEQAKMPLTPRHPEAIGKGLTMLLVRIDPPGETAQLEVPTLAVPLQQKTEAVPRSSKFFPTGPKFTTPGRWMIVATAGVNWGCFVLDRPVKQEAGRSLDRLDAE